MKSPVGAGWLRRPYRCPGGIAILTHQRTLFPSFLRSDTPLKTDSVDAAWALSRAIAVRRYVNTMIPEHDGALRANNYPRKFPTVGHTPPSTPWTIDLTDDVENLFHFALFDLDAKTPDAFEQAAEDLGVLVRILRACAIPHVVCRSSPGGGFHVWVPLAGVGVDVMRQLAISAKAVLPSLDHGLLCNGRTGAARPPGAPHARGGFSQVMDGADPVDVLLERTVTADDLLRVIAALQALRPAVDPAVHSPTGPADDRHRAHRELPSWGAAHMATIGGGADPSRTGYLCLLAAAVAGWTFADVQRAAITAPGMEHYRTRNTPAGRREERTPAEAADRLKRQWARAQAKAVEYRYAPQERAERDLSELTGIVGVVEGMLTAFRVSPGRWARSESDLHDSTILTALGWLSLRSGQRDVTAALRTLAGLTGIPSTSVDRSLRRLRSGGWITRVRSAEGINAAVWKVNEKFSTERVHNGPHQDVNARPPDLLFDTRVVLLEQLSDRMIAGRSDVFTRRGLGHTARRVYEVLTGDVASDEVVAERSGLPRGRVRAALARLRRFSLVVQRRGAWRRRKNDYRPQAARRLGVEGILARRDQQYAWERELWAWWNAELTSRAGRAAPPRRRRDPRQGVMFRLSDSRGDELSWPAYPRDGEGLADHKLAMSYVRRGLLQQLRDAELSFAA